MRGRDSLDFSFSGLKTAVRHLVVELGESLDEGSARSDLAASFQAAVADVLEDRCRRALARFRRDCGRGGPLVVAGGVAANRFLRARLGALAETHGAALLAPPPALCTDNAAMIAWAGVERFRLGDRDSLSFAPRPRWPLHELAAAGPEAARP